MRENEIAMPATCTAADGDVRGQINAGDDANELAASGSSQEVIAFVS